MKSPRVQTVKRGNVTWYVRAASAFEWMNEWMNDQVSARQMICAVLDVWFNALTLCSKLNSFFYINIHKTRPIIVRASLPKGRGRRKSSHQCNSRKEDYVLGCLNFDHTKWDQINAHNECTKSVETVEHFLLQYPNSDLCRAVMRCARNWIVYRCYFTDKYA